MRQTKDFDTFTDLVDRVLAVPHSVIQERVNQDRKRADNHRNAGGLLETAIAVVRSD